MVALTRGTDILIMATTVSRPADFRQPITAWFSRRATDADISALAALGADIVRISSSSSPGFVSIVIDDARIPAVRALDGVSGASLSDVPICGF